VTRWAALRGMWHCRASPVRKGAQARRDMYTL